MTLNLPLQNMLDPPASVLYKPLRLSTKDFRLLILEPGAGDDPLRCHLKHVNLLEPSAELCYETISYVWGDSTHCEYIRIDNQPVSIPASSKAALYRMRRPSQPRALWIDSVCINQKNPVERSHQVAMMSEIYSSSIANLVWLGDADDFTESALASIQLVLDEVRFQAKDPETLTELLYDESGFLMWKIDAISSAIDYQACVMFFSNRWFTRRWVVQEIALAPSSTVYCGAFERPLEDILLAAAWITCNYLTWSKMGCCPGMLNASLMHNFSGGWYDRQLKAGRTVEVRLSVVLGSLQNFHNDDPKDCVYAVLALYQQHNSRLASLPALVRPDYTLPLDTILTRAARLCLIDDTHLRLLNETQHRVSEVTEDGPFPTWVPRYDRQHHHSLDASTLIHRFRADDGLGWQATPNNDVALSYIARLPVKGYRLSVVTEATSVMDHRMFCEVEYTRDRLGEIDAVLANINAGPASRNEILGNTLCSSRDYHGELIDPGDATMAFTDYEDTVLQHGNVPPWPDALPDDATHQERRRSIYKHEVYHVCPLRRFFGTSEGQVGVGPQHLVAGDVVAIAFGCQWPIVLRSVPGTRAEHRFIGTAYVYGSMFGEATKRLQAEGREVDDFMLI